MIWGGILHAFLKHRWGRTLRSKLYFFRGKGLEKFSITSLAHNWIDCSEWVPSEEIIPTTPVQHQETNPSFVKMFWTSNLCFGKKMSLLSKTLLSPWSTSHLIVLMLTLASPTNNASNMNVVHYFKDTLKFITPLFSPTGKINTALMYKNTIN